MYTFENEHCEARTDIFPIEVFTYVVSLLWCGRDCWLRFASMRRCPVTFPSSDLDLEVTIVTLREILGLSLFDWKG